MSDVDELLSFINNDNETVRRIAMYFPHWRLMQAENSNIFLSCALLGFD
jgi:hypothetical protein